MKKGAFVLFSLLIGFSCYFVAKVHSSQVQDTEIVVEDSLKRSLHFEQEPQRILSLAPSTTEILTALGLEDRFIKAPEFKAFPTMFSQSTQPYTFPETNIEEPDIVFVEGKENFEFYREKFENENWTVFVYDPTSLDEIFGSIEKISKIFGRERMAQTIIEAIRAIMSYIGGQIKPLKQAKVFLQVASNPLRTVEKNSFTHELVSVVGGVNISHNALKSDPPDIIVIASEKSQFDSLKSKWQQMPDLPAVRDNKIYWIDSQTVLEPSPRIAEGMVTLSKILHFPQTVEE